MENNETKNRRLTELVGGHWHEPGEETEQCYENGCTDEHPVCVHCGRTYISNLDYFGETPHSAIVELVTAAVEGFGASAVYTSLPTDTLPIILPSHVIAEAINDLLENENAQ